MCRRCAALSLMQASPTADSATLHLRLCKICPLQGNPPESLLSRRHTEQVICVKKSRRDDIRITSGVTGGGCRCKRTIYARKSRRDDTRITSGVTGGGCRCKRATHARKSRRHNTQGSAGHVPPLRGSILNAGQSNRRFRYATSAVMQNMSLAGKPTGIPSITTAYRAGYLR